MPHLRFVTFVASLVFLSIAGGASAQYYDLSYNSGYVQGGSCAPCGGTPAYAYYAPVANPGCSYGSPVYGVPTYGVGRTFAAQPVASARGGYSYGYAAPRQVAYRPLVPLVPPSSNVQLGQGLLGQPTAYVPGQPIRNFLRYVSPF